MTKKELLDRIRKDSVDLAVLYKVDGDDDLSGYWFDVSADAVRCNQT